MGRRVKLMLGAAFDGWRPGVKEGAVYYDGDLATKERALIVAGVKPAGDGRDLGREKRVLLSLNHPNLLRLLSLALAPGSKEPVFAYAFHDSVSLARLIRALRVEHGLLPWGVAVSVVAAVARGAQAVLHGTAEYPGYSMFHVGPTPDDILIDRLGHVRASGFEVWKETSRVQSSPGYGPPEEGLESSAFVYSLGALLVEMLCGDRPPTGSRALARHREMVRRVQVKVLARPGDRLPEALVDVVAECLDQEPKTRPSLSQLVDRLEALTRRTAGVDLAAWSGRVVPALQAGEALTESVMALDPRLGMSPSNYEDELDPEARPTTIDPARAVRKARLAGGSDFDAAGRDSMHGLVSPVGVAAPQPADEYGNLPPVAAPHRRDTWGDDWSDESENPAADFDLDGPADLPGETPERAASSKPEADAGLPMDVELPVPVDAPATREDEHSKSPEDVAETANLATPEARASGEGNPFGSIVKVVALVLVAGGAGWLARGIGQSSDPVPQTSAPAVAEPPSSPRPAPAVPEPQAPAPPASAPAKATEVSTTVKSPKTSPAAGARVPGRSAQPPAEPQPAAPEAPSEAEAAADGTEAGSNAPFEVVFRSADPSITELTVKCHRGDGKGSSVVTISNVEPGPCRVTANQGGRTVNASVAVSGPRTFTCFAGGSRGCR